MRSYRADDLAAGTQREMRRQAAEADAATLRERGAANDRDPLVDWTVGHLDSAGWQ